jgi:hypothetical protein
LRSKRGLVSKKVRKADGLRAKRDRTDVTGFTPVTATSSLESLSFQTPII